MGNIKIEIPDGLKWEAVGKGIVETLSGRQARIDRLERLIFCLYEHICKEVESTLPFEDDLETSLYRDILKKFYELKKNK